MVIKINKVLVSDQCDSSALDVLRKRNIEVDINTGLSKDEIIKIIPGYDALIVRSATQVTADIINAGVNLKVIGRAGVGVDNIDVDAATKKGVLVINAPSGNTLAAAELTCCMIMNLARHVPAANGKLKNGVWDKKSFMGCELYGKTLAIIGLGRIGREVAHRMQSFGMKTIGFDPIVSAKDAEKLNIQSMTLEEIWPKADFITLHVPLINATKNLIGKETLNKCKKGVQIVNVARGGIVDEDALLESLNVGHCGGAGLDVFEEEPSKNTALLNHPKTIVTPHLGASTKEAQVKVAIEISQQFLDLVEGKSVPGAVNKV